MSMYLRTFLFSTGFMFLSVACVYANSDELELKWGGYVDTYYAYDFNSPTGNSRNPLPLVLFTQATDHNAFNLGLAFLEAKISGNKIRGRLAFQTGTSVPANYTSEGSNVLAKLVQEAIAGYEITENLWIDAGIYFSPIGFESWISRNNWLYTRALMSDFIPYYQSGAKVSYKINDNWAAQLHLINGWQNITENNDNLALNAQVAYTPSVHFSLTYNTFYGLETSNKLPRYFNELVATFSLTHQWQLAAVVDYGIQKRLNDSSYVDWYQCTFWSRYQISALISLAARFENYIDREGIIVQTMTPNGFQTLGFSFGANIQLHKNLMFRSEVRGLWSKDAVFASQAGKSNKTGVIVTALNLTF